MSAAKLLSRLWTLKRVSAKLLSMPSPDQPRHTKILPCSLNWQVCKARYNTWLELACTVCLDICSDNNVAHVDHSNLAAYIVVCTSAFVLLGQAMVAVRLFLLQKQ